MSTDVELTFPSFFTIEVAPEGRRHVGRALLIPSLSAEGTTPAQATHRLLDLVRTAIREKDPEIARRLVAVPPEAESSLATLAVPWRGRRLDLVLRVMRFELGGQGFACLPRLGATLPVPAGLAEAERHPALQAAVDRWFRRRRVAEPEADEEPWSDRRGDRVIWLDARVRVPWHGLDDEDPASLLRALFGQGPLDGRAELAKVSKRLDGLYPDRLLYDHVPDPRVEPLRRLLFEDPHPIPTALVGPAGSGKTTLLHAAVKRHLDTCFAEKASRIHEQARIHHLDPNRVIAGMSTVGAWERRLVAILEHLVDPDRRRPRDGLFIDQPLALARVGRSAGSALTITTVLRPWVERRRIPVVLECTAEAWTMLEELDRAFADLFHVVRIEAPRWDDAMERVLANVEEIERAGNTVFTPPALRRLAELHARFPAGRGLPGGMVDRLGLLATHHAGATIGVPEVDSAFAALTGLRPELFNPEVPLLDAPLRAAIAERLIGQPQAVDALAEVVHVLRAGLARPGKPLASWLLVGPTGVGKTEAAKVLAALLFTDPERLVRLDMNEYVDDAAVSRLLGDGRSEGHLPARLRRHPVAVLLLDEIEKAHPAVHDLLLQMLDEGRITDSTGRVLDLQKVAILLTSNVGAGEIARGAGFDHRRASVPAAFVSAVERAFRPELVNRLDRILVFAPLELPDIRRIAHLQITRILGREGFLRRTVLLDVPSEVLDRLAEAGFDPELGARALKRVLEARLVGQVATMLASVPLDRPLVLRMSAEESTLRATPRLLTFATLRGPPAPVELPTEAALVALREALPAANFRITSDATGSHVEGGETLRLRDRIDAALALLEVEAPATDVEDRHLARIASRAHRFRGKGRGRWRSDTIDWMNVVSFRSVREFLLDRGATADGAIETAHVPRMPLLRLQVAAVNAGSPARCRLHLSGVVDDGAPLWRAAAPYLAALRAAITTVGGHVTPHTRTRRGWEENDDLTLPGPRLWHVDGPAVAHLLAAEVGIHLVYPSDAPPIGLAVNLLGPDDTDTPPLPDTITRLYVEGGDAEDLASGLSTRFESGYLADVLPMIWWQSAGAR